MLSISSAHLIKEEGHQKIWKKAAKVHVETSDQLVIMKKEQREEYRKKITEYAAEAGWKECKSHYDHHMLYDVGK